MSVKGQGKWKAGRTGHKNRDQTTLDYVESWHDDDVVLSEWCGGGWRTWPCFVVDSRREQLAIAATNLESLQFHASVRSCPGSISYFITIPSSVVDAVVVVFRLLLAESFLHINHVLRRYPSASSSRGISALEGAGRRSNITNQMFCDFCFGVLALGNVIWRTRLAITTHMASALS